MHSKFTDIQKADVIAQYAERGYPEGLVFHSDQGTQYTSAAFRALLSSYGVTQSFSYPGRPVDNAVAESFFANLKREELYRHDYRSEREFREAVTDYIENYNSVRPHRSNNYKSPNIKERDFKLLFQSTLSRAFASFCVTAMPR